MQDVILLGGLDLVPRGDDAFSAACPT